MALAEEAADGGSEIRDALATISPSPAMTSRKISGTDPRKPGEEL
jgi:hypothetical protein